MITSLTEIIELPNFGHMTKSTLQFESQDKILLVTPWIEIMTSKPFFKNLFKDGLGSPFLLKSSKLLPCLSKRSLKTQENLEELEIMYLNGIYIFIS